MKKAAWILLLMTASSPVAADLVHLKDGTVLEGDLKRNDDGWRITTADGSFIDVTERQVARVEIQPRSLEGPGGDAVAVSRLNSLKKSVESLDDPQAAIERYDSFIERYADTSVVADAKAQRQVWVDRKQQGLVRQGSQWVTPQQRETLRAQATAQAAQARQLVRLGRVTDAQPLLEQALAIDPANISALYVHGLLRFRADKLADARRAFEQIAVIAPDHAPTLNNLAVIAWRQNRTTDALQLYERAMTAAPMNQMILSNVAEVLNALPRDAQKNAPAQRVYRLFSDQDQRLQAQLASEGIYRWGAQYLSREQFEQVQARQRELQQQLDAMAEQFAATEQRIRDLDVKGEANDRTLRQLEAGSYHRTPEGNLVRLPLPPVYREIQRDNERLKLERRQAVGELDRLRQSAAQLQEQMPQPRFTGVQNIMDVEGTPLIPPSTEIGDGANENQADEATAPAPQTVREVRIGPSTQPAAPGQP